MDTFERLRAAKKVCGNLHLLKQSGLVASFDTRDIDKQIEAAEEWYHGLKEQHERISTNRS
jgi:hypothetical protein